MYCFRGIRNFLYISSMAIRTLHANLFPLSLPSITAFPCSIFALNSADCFAKISSLCSNRYWSNSGDVLYCHFDSVFSVPNNIENHGMQVHHTVYTLSECFFLLALQIIYIFLDCFFLKHTITYSFDCTENLYPAFLSIQ